MNIQLRNFDQVFTMCKLVDKICILKPLLLTGYTFIFSLLGFQYQLKSIGLKMKHQCQNRLLLEANFM